MYKQEHSEILSLYAVSPVHAGSGTSLGIVDLPIQRERHTNWPHIQASGVKGAMRHHFEQFKNNLLLKDAQQDVAAITDKIFGAEDFRGEGSLPGAIAVSDAKLLAYPMRSSHSPFVWITCPSVLQRLTTDLQLTGKATTLECPAIPDDEAVVIHGPMRPGDRILLEDYEVQVSATKPPQLSQTVQRMLGKASRLLLVSDTTFHYGVSHCTEIRAQIKIDAESGTTVSGSLRYEEVLPADAMMYVILFYGATRNSELSSPLQAQTLINYMKNDVMPTFLQIGGNETLGYGLFQIDWIQGGPHD